MINSGTMAMKKVKTPPESIRIFQRVFRSEFTWGIIHISNGRISITILELRYSNVRRLGFCLEIIEPPPKD